MLTHKELVDLTHKERASAQVRALNKMGIDHIIRGDGSVVVLRETLIARVSRVDKTQKKSAEPDWSAI